MSAASARQAEGPRKVRDFPPGPQKGDPAELRQRRLDRLYTARRVVPNTPTGGCLRYVIDQAVGFQLVDRDGYVSPVGVQRCGRRGCPWCNARFAQLDCERAEGFLLGWVERGSAIAMPTFTLRHKAGESFSEVWSAHVAVLDSLHHGRPWERFKEKWGLLEFGYGNECPMGDNGPHRHQHRCWEMRMTPELRTRRGRHAAARRMEAEYEALYQAALKKHGRSARPGIGLKLKIAAPTKENAAKAAAYATKFAKEATLGHAKTARRGNREPFELLDDAEDDSLSAAQRAKAKARYAEFYEQSRGKRWTYWSEAGKDDDGAGEEPEIDEPGDEPGTVVFTGSAVEWRMLDFAHRVGWLCDLVETSGPIVARAELRRFCNSQHWSKEFMQRMRSTPPQGP